MGVSGGLDPLDLVHQFDLGVLVRDRRRDPVKLSEVASLDEHPGDLPTVKASDLDVENHSIPLDVRNQIRFPFRRGIRP
jgi:hypothetical protein